MNDVNGRTVEVGMIVTISNAYSDKDNGRFVVEDVWNNQELTLQKLGAKGQKLNCEKNYWPLNNYSSKREIREAANMHNQIFACIEIVSDKWIEPEIEVKQGMSFTMYGIKYNGKFIKCTWYKRNDGSIVVDGYHYGHVLPRCLGNVVNNSDCMTDYFECDSCILRPGDKYFDEVKKACEKYQAHVEARFEKKYGTR